VTPHSVVIEYQHSRGPHCLHLQGEVNGPVYQLALLLMLVLLSFPASYWLPDHPFLFHISCWTLPPFYTPFSYQCPFFPVPFTSHGGSKVLCNIGNTMSHHNPEHFNLNPLFHGNLKSATS